MRVLTWHIHGSYLWYLAHVSVEWYLPVRPGASGSSASSPTG
jgi:hypothetical protein